VSLKLYYHPLSSFCWKALIALYENGVPFEKVLVNLGDPEERANFLKIAPLGKFPVVMDEARNWVVPESGAIIEYLDQRYPGKIALLPEDADLARQVRLRERVFDLYIHMPMQRIVGENLRPEGSKDPYGVAEARRQLDTSYKLVEDQIGDNVWAMGNSYTMADCAASPALWYANRVHPIPEDLPRTRAYLGRLNERPSFLRVKKEAEPYMHMFPG
jgi:glutathione S-transferase